MYMPTLYARQSWAAHKYIKKHKSIKTKQTLGAPKTIISLNINIQFFWASVSNCAGRASVSDNIVLLMCQNGQRSRISPKVLVGFKKSIFTKRITIAPEQFSLRENSLGWPNLPLRSVCVPYLKSLHPTSICRKVKQLWA